MPVLVLTEICDECDVECPTELCDDCGGALCEDCMPGHPCVAFDDDEDEDEEG